MAARLKQQYNERIRGELREQFKYENVMQVPRLMKIIVNMGAGDAQTDQRLLDTAATELGIITGQKAAIRKAKKSISGFKVRAGAKIACMVTLRGDRMFEFMDRLFNIAIPRIRDFRGLNPNSFDQHGNFTLGIRDQTIFPEIDIDKVTRVRGMNVTFVIRNGNTPEESRELLRKFGMPFRN